MNSLPLQKYKKTPRQNLEEKSPASSKRAPDAKGLSPKKRGGDILKNGQNLSWKGKTHTPTYRRKGGGTG